MKISMVPEMQIDKIRLLKIEAIKRDVDLEQSFSLLPLKHV